ncbi:MAG: cupredoxin family copper-binding protein [Candidatus Diapherotrites archaeon]|nr:cupredoxin family copper-binding protein [Candidatus Diapherotrites archaeon]
MNSKILVFGILLAMALALAGCAQQTQNPPANNPPAGNNNLPPASTGAKTIAVEISNFAFAPAELTIKVGDSVTWTNKDSVGHTATGDNGEFDSGLLSTGQSFTQTFNTAGTFNYHCTPHPYMKAIIKVQ